jgi:hypothetical protein
VRTDGSVPAADRGAEFQGGAGDPGPGSKSFEGIVRCGQLRSGCSRGVRAAELLAVGEPDPGQVEGPFPDAGQAERGLEERGRATVRRGRCWKSAAADGSTPTCPVS